MGADKKSVFDIVVERLLDIMKQGTVPWHANWNRQCPMNMFSKKVYRGMNTLLLSTSPSPYFMTMKQINDMGGLRHQRREPLYCYIL